MVGVSVLYTTTEANVVRNFLLACAVADIGHLYVTYVSILDRFLSLERHFGNFMFRGSIYVLL